MDYRFSSAAIRTSVEAALSQSTPSALTPKPRVISERLASEATAFDLLTDGGLPVGAISEFVGVASSGRTTMALTFVAAAIRAEKVVAWVDLGDSFDPESAATNGIELSRLLWVRCKRPTPARVEAKTPTSSLVPPSVEMQHVVRGGGSPHPRSEGRGMPEAIQAMLKAHGGLFDKHARREKKNIGTPGMANRPLTRVIDREEQIPTDRISRRRNQLPFEPRDTAPSTPAHKIDMPTAAKKPCPSTSPWKALDHALRAVDLLLQAGGFSIIVLDMGDVPADIAWRVPLATWFRFRAACERSRTSLLLLTRHPCARSSAELVVRLQAGEMQANGGVMTGVAFQAEVERQRFNNNVIPIRKPPQSAGPGSVQGRAAWAI